MLKHWSGIQKAITLSSVEVELGGIVKGVGEGGTVGATPAVINAVLDALAPLGVTDIGLPATPQRIWQAIQSAAPRSGGAQNGAS